MTAQSLQKRSGAYFTPDAVVASLLRWGVRKKSDRLLDPSCGDGRFIAGHRNSVGIEQDPASARIAIDRAPWALVHEGDFFAWASETPWRFECAVGNPPFIRYQTFKGQVRATAAALCKRLGAEFSGLSSSWAPFLVATASLLKPGGRMAFVVPAEIGHAPYAAPLLDYLVSRFDCVHVIAVRQKLFSNLSEDCWLLHAEGFGGSTSEIRFSMVDRFVPSDRPPTEFEAISVAEWRHVWKQRLRPYLMHTHAREQYRILADQDRAVRLGDIAAVGIGYVSGANDFFHLRPSEADRWKIPQQFLHPTVRNGRALPSERVTASVVDQWKREDEAILLLRLPKSKTLPAAVRRYLDTDAGKAARAGYKCRMREPWYSVPDVQIPDYFLSYMSGQQAQLVRNDAECTCTNSLHSVRLRSRSHRSKLQSWGSEFVQLSVELEGHPLGGGMLKVEPREASRIVLPDAAALKSCDSAIVTQALETLRTWRHYGGRA